MKSLSERLGKLSESIGHAIAWLTLPMVLVTFAVAVLRYGFHLGWIWMQESVIWMHAVVFMLGSAYALYEDAHVRVDIFYRGMSQRGKAWVNFWGTLLYLLPVSIFLIVSSMDYVTASWVNHEGSREAGGLPFPFVPALKTVIPVAFALVILQGIAMLINSALYLFSREAPAREHHETGQL